MKRIPAPMQYIRIKNISCERTWLQAIGEVLEDIDPEVGRRKRVSNCDILSTLRQTQPRAERSFGKHQVMCRAQTKTISGGQKPFRVGSGGGELPHWQSARFGTPT